MGALSLGLPFLSPRLTGTRRDGPRQAIPSLACLAIPGHAIPEHAVTSPDLPCLPNRNGPRLTQPEHALPALPHLALPCQNTPGLPGRLPRHNVPRLACRTSPRHARTDPDEPNPACRTGTSHTEPCLALPALPRLALPRRTEPGPARTGLTWTGQFHVMPRTLVLRRFPTPRGNYRSYHPLRDAIRQHRLRIRRC